MILKMKKFTSLVYHKEFEQVLLKIRQSGLLHIHSRLADLQDESLLSRQSLQKNIDNAIKFLEGLESDVLSRSEGEYQSGIEVFQKYNLLIENREKLFHEKQLTEKDLKTLLPWGEFSWDTVSKLSEVGLNAYFFSISSSRFDNEWIEKFNAFIVSNEGSLTYFVTFANEKPEIDAEPVKLPEVSISNCNKIIAEIEIQISKVREELSSLKKYVHYLSDYRNHIQDEVGFILVNKSAVAEVDDMIMVLEGWLPAEEEERFLIAISDLEIYYELAKPTEGENVPVKLKNNRFAKLFTPIGDLYTLPTYSEIDLTPFFAPFYMLFFGFCLGDTGYGLLIFLAVSFLKLKAKASLKPILSLGQWLGISTIVMGIFSGTFFGIFLTDLQVSWIQGIRKLFLDQDQLMFLSLGLGLFQVLFGMVINVANLMIQQGWKYGIAKLGWVISIVMGILLYANSEKYITLGLANNLVLALAILGLDAAFFYNTPAWNAGKRGNLDASGRRNCYGIDIIGGA